MKSFEVPDTVDPLNDRLMVEYFAKHCAAGGLVIVLAFKTGAGGEHQDERLAVFSSLERARAWSHSLGDEWACLYSPHIVDEPDWGETPLGRLS